MNLLSDEIVAYDAAREQLEKDHLGKWVIFHDGHLHGVYDEMESAAQEATERFGRGPYLIRQVGAPPVTLPASIMYRVVYGDDKMRF